MPYCYASQSDPGEHQAEFDRLWAALVPPSGPAATAQGEMIRSAGRLASEYYRNGNVNWIDPRTRQFYAGFVDYIERTLAQHGPRDFVVRAAPYLSALRDIGRYVADPPDFSFDPWDALIHLVVEWCMAHPVPIPVGDPAN